MGATRVYCGSTSSSPLPFALSLSKGVTCEDNRKAMGVREVCLGSDGNQTEDTVEVCYDGRKLSELLQRRLR